MHDKLAHTDSHAAMQSSSWSRSRVDSRQRHLRLWGQCTPPCRAAFTKEHHRLSSRTAEEHRRVGFSFPYAYGSSLGKRVGTAAARDKCHPPCGPRVLRRRFCPAPPLHPPGPGPPRPPGAPRGPSRPLRVPLHAEAVGPEAWRIYVCALEGVHLGRPRARALPPHSRRAPRIPRAGGERRAETVHLVVGVGDGDGCVVRILESASKFQLHFKVSVAGFSCNCRFQLQSPFSSE